MLNKKTIKIIFSVLIGLMLLTTTISVIAAPISPGDISVPNSIPGDQNLQDFGGMLVGILQTAGVVVAVVILLVLGVKYMMGSAEEKSEYKKSMMPYLVGAILIFAATTVTNIVYQFANGLNQ